MTALLLVLAITGVGTPTIAHTETMIPDPEPHSHAPALPADSELLDRIIGCESGGDPTARNPVSSASGILQFVDGTWRYVWTDYLGSQPPTARAYQATVAEQMRAGRALYEREGTRPWNASRSCWGPA